MARLVIFDETVRGLDLPQHPIILGRSQKVDVPIHDSVLSRKHCSIVPAGAGLCLIDLKSSNGTYLNGQPVERSPLEFDDIIEIGNTVIVLLDTKTWNRGEGLTRFRNPVKAQELIQAIKKRGGLPKNGKADKGARGPALGAKSAAKGRNAPLKDKRKLLPAEAAFLQEAEAEVFSSPITRELLEAYAYHRVASLLAWRSGELRDILGAVLDRVLTPEAFAADSNQLRAAIHHAVGEALAEKRARNASASSDDATADASVRARKPGAKDGSGEDEYGPAG